MYLQRHGESQTNLSNQFTCRKLDPDLTDKGQAQIKRLIPFYNQKGIKKIITSPSRRAVQTAKILGDGLGVQVIKSDSLLEVNLGDLEGKNQSDPTCLDVLFNILLDWLKHGKKTPFPGGESMNDVTERIRQVFDLGASSTVMVGHATFFAVLVGTNGMHFDHIEELFLPNAGIAHQTIHGWELVNIPDRQLSGSL